MLHGLFECGAIPEVRATVEIIDSFSGQADHSELREYFQRSGGTKERVWLVRGEPQNAEWLRDGLVAIHPESIEVAQLGTKVEF